MHYITKTVFRVCREGESYSEFDEQWRLCEAENELQAYEEALESARAEEGSFTEIKSGQIIWQLVDVCEVFPLADARAVLWTATVKEERAEDYITFVKNRAARFRAVAGVKNMNRQPTAKIAHE